ncbi:hypothetical protein ACIA8O_38710 [Kitasatospora sp. NPDC051853]|uniref:hypothetical protein n=1 Tax=Kitasatospora sp. NPDC051853 TaxID=3364058 RepID=UPI003792FA06
MRGPDDQVLYVNAKSALDADTAEEFAERILGDWLPSQPNSTRFTRFDPDKIDYVVGCAKGKVLAVFEVKSHHGADGTRPGYELIDDPARPGRRRVRFHGDISDRFAHLAGTAAPRTWAKGDATPVKTGSVIELEGGDANITVAPGGGWHGDFNRPARRTVLGQAVVTADDRGNITVEVPAGINVTVVTRPAGGPENSPV